MKKQLILLDQRYFKEEHVAFILETLPNSMVILCEFPTSDYSMVKILKI